MKTIFLAIAIWSLATGTATAAKVLRLDANGRSVNSIPLLKHEPLRLEIKKPMDDNERICVIYYGVSFIDSEMPKNLSPELPEFLESSPSAAKDTPPTNLSIKPGAGVCHRLPYTDGKYVADLEAVDGEALRFYVVRVRKAAPQPETPSDAEYKKAKDKLDNANEALQLLKEKIKAFAGMASDSAATQMRVYTDDLQGKNQDIRTAKEKFDKEDESLKEKRKKYENDLKEAEQFAVLRIGTMPLGGDILPVYYRLVDHSKDNPQVPFRLERLRDFPVFTTKHRPTVVVLDHQLGSQPADFRMNFGLEKGEFINVAPVRPPDATAPIIKALKMGEPFKATKPEKKELYLSSAYVDHVLVFSKKVPGEMVPKVTVTALASVVTEDKKETSGEETTVKRTEETKVVNLLDAEEWPQVHSLYHFNITTGVIATWLRDPTFSRVVTMPPVYGDPTDASKTTVLGEYATATDKGSPRAMPILAFTMYVRPKDVQVPFTWHEMISLKNCSPTVGFSLSSPAEDFFFGLSSEIVRNVHVVYGYHYGQITFLGPQGTDDIHSSAAPATIKRFKGEFFAGLTFNIGLIPSLFK